MVGVIAWYLLLIATASSAVALFISIINERDKEQLVVKIEAPKMPEGLSRYELNKITSKLLREERKRSRGNRRVW